MIEFSRPVAIDIAAALAGVDGACIIPVDAVTCAISWAGIATIMLHRSRSGKSSSSSSLLEGTRSARCSPEPEEGQGLAGHAPLTMVTVVVRRALRGLILF